MAKRFLLSEKHYNDCMSRVSELIDVYEITRDPNIKLRLNYYKTLVSESEPADISALKETHVNIGDRVTISIDMGDGFEDPESYQLLLGFANVRENKISISSPLGSEIYLKEVGETVEYLVKGKTLKAKILSKESVVENNEADEGEKV